MTKRRLFFGLEVVAPWPAELPKGRVLPEEGRHMTLVFLGNVEWEELEARLDQVPPLPMRVGAVGVTDECLLLRNVVAWHVNLFEQGDVVDGYYQTLRRFCEGTDEREWRAHITMARKPFDGPAWKKAFEPLPVAIKGMHLYESTGNLTYVPVRSWEMAAPFLEVPHTADIAFEVRGESVQQIFLHAAVALAFEFPPLLGYMGEVEVVDLDDVIIALNDLVARADADVGVPFKAVSFAGELRKFDGLLEWEMIVDV
jgi:RNA 2',3'-cyclic 3'-phosphodiesterase